MKISSRKREVGSVLIVLVLAFSAMGCSKKTAEVQTPSAVRTPPMMGSPAVESPMMGSPAVESPVQPSGITASMVVDAMGEKAQKQFCVGYAAMNDEQAAMAAFMSGYQKNTSPSGEEVFAELVSRC